MASCVQTETTGTRKRWKDNERNEQMKNERDREKGVYYRERDLTLSTVERFGIVFYWPVEKENG